MEKGEDSESDSEDPLHPPLLPPHRDPSSLDSPRSCLSQAPSLGPPPTSPPYPSRTSTNNRQPKLKWPWEEEDQGRREEKKEDQGNREEEKEAWRSRLDRAPKGGLGKAKEKRGSQAMRKIEAKAQVDGQREGRRWKRRRQGR
jgi:hypothetical protein